MINYVCDICGKTIGTNKKLAKKETPKYGVQIRKYSHSKHDGKLHSWSEYVDICDECQAKVDAALDPIFEKMFTVMGEILEEE